MTGYLRWLATRALGQGAGIRPARHPISLASGLLGEMRPTSDHADAFSIDTGQGQFERTLAETPRQQLTPRSEMDAPSPAAPRSAPGPELGSDPVSAGVQPGAPGGEASSHSVATRTTTDDEQRLVLERPSALAPKQPAPELGRGLAEDVPQLVRAASVPDETSMDVVSRPRADQRPPAAPRIAARLRNRPADPRSIRSDAAPPPDVHIHIGRVELTAITPAATPARREPAAAAKKPMSLDEYLRQRGRRPS